MRMNEERVCHMDDHLEYERDNDYWNEICESEIDIDQPTEYICDDYESMYPILPSMTDENVQLFRKTFLNQSFSGVTDARVNKKPQKFIFEYWAFSQKSYLNGGCFEEIHICIPKILYLHTS